ncbi:hypothetical protein [Candidatus Poriferisocius sp.]|uniref:hypothetical protein n=1 Tax=Candidatus Poriferisocius sp. TaxID=3101276 RepID=UPI003B017A78
MADRPNRGMVRDRVEWGNTVGTVRNGRLLVVVTLLLLVLAACANSGAPTTYEDNPAEYQGEPDVGQAERNFRDGCEESGRDDLSDDVKQNLADVCKCSFDAIKDEFPNFEDFKKLDDDLRSNINTRLPESVKTKIGQCIKDEAGI